MRTSRLLLSMLAAAALVCASGMARATPVTFYFSGAFTTTTGLATSFTNRDFVGQFTYDTTWVPIFTGSNFTQYRMPVGGLSASSLDGSSSSQGSPNNLVNMVWDSTIGSTTIAGTGDYLHVSSLSDFTGSWLGFDGASLILLDVGATALGPTLSALPSSMDLANWTSTEFRISDQTGGSVAVGALTCASTDASVCTSQRIPEPSTLLLAGLALAGLSGARRKRST